MQSDLSTQATQRQKQGQRQSHLSTQATQRQEAQKNIKTRIYFKRLDQTGRWRDKSVLTVDPSDPSEVMRMAKENMREKLMPFDTGLGSLTADECYNTVISDGTNTILLIPASNIVINEELMESAKEVRTNALSHAHAGWSAVVNRVLSSVILLVICVEGSFDGTIYLRLASNALIGLAVRHRNLIYSTSNAS